MNPTKPDSASSIANSFTTCFDTNTPLYSQLISNDTSAFSVVVRPRLPRSPGER